MRVLISGGGTGGHIYPALSIIKEINRREPGSQFLYIGTAKGLESDIVKKANIPFQAIEITGFKRKISFDNVKTIYRFLKGVRESKKIIQFFKPDIVIGTGGYVCGPVVYAAARLKVPTLIHEQNVIPGLTNKFLSRFTTAIAVSFDGSATQFNHPQVEITGNPRATEVVEASALEGRRMHQIPLDKKVVLIVGGSRGAKAINQSFIEMIEELDQLPNCYVIYVTGEVHYEDVVRQIKERGLSLANITIKPFIYDMPNVLAATDLIINRAGASFLAEITSLGLPSILIPSPYVTNNHQEKNARWLEAEGASKVILEQDLNGKILFETIKQLIEREELLGQMKEASKGLGQPEASSKIYYLIQKIIE